jgi:hypothetical protein
MFLPSAIVRGDRSASLSGSLFPVERDKDTHLIVGWMGPTSNLDDVKKENV